MRKTDIFLIVTLALIGFAGSAALSQLLQHYPINSWQRDWLSGARVLIWVLSVVNIGLVVMRAFSEPEKMIPKTTTSEPDLLSPPTGLARILLINLAIVLIAVGIIWFGSHSAHEFDVGAWLVSGPG